MQWIAAHPQFLVIGLVAVLVLSALLSPLRPEPADETYSYRSAGPLLTPAEANFHSALERGSWLADSPWRVL